MATGMRSYLCLYLGVKSSKLASGWDYSDHKLFLNLDMSKVHFSWVDYSLRLVFCTNTPYGLLTHEDYCQC